jgi:hypothetical protein
MKVLSKPINADGEKILQTLSDKKLKTFSQLKEKCKLSAPTLSRNLKTLQKQKMVSKDIDTRCYEIQKDGIEHLKKASAADTIVQGNVVENPKSAPPTQSIIGIDIPGIKTRQQQILMAGTIRTAEACFNQFYADSQLMNGKIPAGRVTYTVSIDSREMSQWLNTAEGREFLKKRGL